MILCGSVSLWRSLRVSQPVKRLLPRADKARVGIRVAPCSNTSRRSVYKRRRFAMERVCRDSLSGSSAIFLRAGAWPAGLRAFAVTHADSIGWPFSCKGRGFCPSGGGRRMAERAAHLVDHVFPAVPVRQWVLSLPPRLRYLLAWNHDLCRAVVRVYVRTVLGFLRHVARQTGVGDGRGGAVAIVQRFGGAMNLHVRVRYLA